jgi:hypothetical protein
MCSRRVRVFGWVCLGLAVATFVLDVPGQPWVAGAAMFCAGGLAVALWLDQRQRWAARG